MKFGIMQMVGVALVGGAAIHLAFVACSGNGSPGGDAASGGDTGVPVADAQGMPGGTLLMGNCDQTYTVANPGMVAATFPVAVIPVAGLDPRQAPHVATYVCDPNPGTVADPYLGACGADGGTTCSFTPPTTQCLPLNPYQVFVYPGEVVVSCGLAPRTFQHVYVRVN